MTDKRFTRHNSRFDTEWDKKSPDLLVSWCLFLGCCIFFGLAAWKMVDIVIWVIK